MNHFKTIILALLSIAFLFASCSIEKRVHRSGYHIDWKMAKTKSSPNDYLKDNHQVTQQLALNKIKSVPTSKTKKRKIIRFNSNVDNTAGSIFSVFDDSTSNRGSDCDLIIYRDGEEIQAKVIEITQKEVKYKKCDNLDGPLFTESKSKIFMIKYPNGTNTVIKKEKSVGQEINEALGFDDDEEEENEKNDQRDGEKEDNPNDRSLLITILLWAFLGVLGIHRFYTGHYVLGVLYLLTGAFCGIGWLIDGILLITGSYSPKEGKFTDDF